jgi:hypothetical protein
MSDTRPATVETRRTLMVDPVRVELTSDCDLRSG